MENKQMSEQIDKLVLALIEVQKAVLPVKFDATNPFFSSKYATLGAVWESYRIPLTDNGLAVSQLGCPAPEGHIGITTVLLHKSGQWLSGTFVMPLKVETKKATGEVIDYHDPQKAGSAITYARRYALSALVMSISEEDDDAERAAGREGGRKTFDQQNAENEARGSRTSTEEEKTPDKPPTPPKVSVSNPNNLATKAQTGYVLKLLDGLNPPLVDRFAGKYNYPAVDKMTKKQASEFIAWLATPGNQPEIKQTKADLLNEAENESK